MDEFIGFEALKFLHYDNWVDYKSYSFYFYFFGFVCEHTFFGFFLYPLLILLVIISIHVVILLNFIVYCRFLKERNWFLQ